MPGKHPIWNNLFQNPSNKTTEITELWLQTPLFRNIPAGVCRQLVQSMHPRHYKKDESVFNVGEIGAGAVLIKSGKIEIRTGDNVLATLGPGDFLGEVALVVDEPRTADAVATETSELIFFLRPDLEEWTQRTPRHGAQFMLNISRVLARRLLKANDLLSQNNG